MLTLSCRFRTYIIRKLDSTKRNITGSVEQTVNFDDLKNFLFALEIGSGNKAVQSYQKQHQNNVNGICFGNFFVHVEEIFDQTGKNNILSRTTMKRCSGKYWIHYHTVNKNL